MNKQECYEYYLEEGLSQFYSYDICGTRWIYDCSDRFLSHMPRYVNAYSVMSYDEPENVNGWWPI